MATITPTKITEAGVKVAFAAVAEAGDEVVATGIGAVVVEFRNDSAGSRTVTLNVPATTIEDPVYGLLTKANQTLVLAAGEEGAFHIEKPGAVVNNSGRVPFTYSDHTDLKIRALRA